MCERLFLCLQNRFEAKVLPTTTTTHGLHARCHENKLPCYIVMLFCLIFCHTKNNISDFKLKPKWSVLLVPISQVCAKKNKFLKNKTSLLLSDLVFWHVFAHSKYCKLVKVQTFCILCNNWYLFVPREMMVWHPFPQHRSSSSSVD